MKELVLRNQNHLLEIPDYSKFQRTKKTQLFNIVKSSFWFQMKDLVLRNQLQVSVIPGAGAESPAPGY